MGEEVDSVGEGGLKDKRALFGGVGGGSEERGGEKTLEANFQKERIGLRGQ